MTYPLDTNVCSAHMRRSAGIAHRLFQHSGRVAVPTVVLGELYAGAFMMGDGTKVLTGLSELLMELDVISFDSDCAEQFGKLRGELKRLGLGVGPIDVQIAAVALVNDLTLVTNNTKDFENIPGLRLEDSKIGLLRDDCESLKCRNF